MMKTGLIARRTIELNSSKVECVQVNHSVFRRVLGFRDVVVVTGRIRETFIDVK
jgi:uncharacterized membrane protein YdbT with pleckstrin-like domain